MKVIIWDNEEQGYWTSEPVSVDAPRKDAHVYDTVTESEFLRRMLLKYPGLVPVAIPDKKPVRCRVRNSNGRYWAAPEAGLADSREQAHIYSSDCETEAARLNLSGAVRRKRGTLELLP